MKQHSCFGCSSCEERGTRFECLELISFLEKRRVVSSKQLSVVEDVRTRS